MAQAKQKEGGVKKEEEMKDEKKGKESSMIEEKMKGKERKLMRIVTLHGSIILESGEYFLGCNYKSGEVVKVIENRETLQVQYNNTTSKISKQEGGVIESILILIGGHIQE